MWEATSNGLYGAAVHSLAIDPKHPATVYAATDTGVWKTKDGGDNWTVANFRLPQARVNALAIDPVTTTTLYAGLSEGGVYKSINQGDTWEAMNNGPPVLASQTVLDLTVDPRHPSYVFRSGGLDNHVYVSSNGGVSWADVSSGIVGAGRIRFVFDDSDRVYAANLSSIHRMRYNEQFWTAVGAMSLAGARYLDAIAYTPHGLYVAGWPTRLYRSVDGGDVWTPVDGATTTFYALGAHRQRLYLGSDIGVYTYDGTTFSLGGGIGEKINVVLADPTNSDVAYAGTWTGVYKTTDGLNWSLATTGLTGTSVTALAIDPQITSNLYVGLSNAGLRRSTDGATSWSPTPFLGSIPPNSDIGAIAVDEANPRVVWAGAYSSLWKSSDGGVSWAESLDRDVSSLASGFGSTSRIYAGVRDSMSATVHVNTPAAGWSVAGVNLPDKQLVAALAINPADSSRVFAGIPDFGVYYTDDGGALWTAVNTGLGSLKVLSLGINPAQPTTVFAGTVDQGIWKTTDGMNWTASSNGLTSLAVTAVAIARTSPSTIYLGTRRNGVFRSTDGGVNWTSYSSGLRSLAITKMVVDPKRANVVYVGTWDGGVNRMIAE